MTLNLLILFCPHLEKIFVFLQSLDFPPQLVDHFNGFSNDSGLLRPHILLGVQGSGELHKAATRR